jgi:hypothetical protein
MRVHRRPLPWCLAVCVFTSLGNAWGFAEEQTDVLTNANASTHHLYLTRALAVCAGFDYATDVVDPVLRKVLPRSEAKEAEIIAFNDEMTDVGTICMQGGEPVTGNVDPATCDSPDTTWTNCSPGSIPDEAIIGDRRGCQGQAGVTAPGDVVWEVFPAINGTPASQGQGLVVKNAAWQPRIGCFSQRFSTWSPLYHFPEKNDLERLRQFAMTEGGQLTARSSYAYGPKNSSMWTAPCFLQVDKAVPTGVVTGGSLEAFGMYLHSLGDYYSHRMCREQWKQGDKPAWYFHTPGPPSAQNVQNCGFNDHALEYGCANSQQRAGFLAGTLEGAAQVYEELLKLSAQKGKKPRIPSLDANHQWLRRQLHRYVTLYQPSVLVGQGAKMNPVQHGAAKCRVSFAWQLLQACVSNASASPDACLPDVSVATGPESCPKAGQVDSCPSGEKLFPSVPRCTSSPKMQ